MVLFNRLFRFILEKEKDLHCKFFDGFGLAVQIILGIMCFSVLIYKRYQEKPMRSWIIWGLDVSKQIFAQLTQHIFNLIVATKIGETGSLECEWYMIQIVGDCSIGVLIQFLYLSSLTFVLKDCGEYKLISGDYGKDQIIFTKYFYQLSLWILVVILAKLTNIGILLIFSNVLQESAKFLLSSLKENIHLKLVVVVIIIPTICNGIQFWITDNFLKKEGIKINSEEQEKKDDIVSPTEINLIIDDKINEAAKS